VKLVNRLLYNIAGNDLGIDLGTANTLIHVRGKGIVISEPSYVALDRRTGEVLSVGADAKAMAGKAPSNIRVVRPLREGVISDFGVTRQLLQSFISKIIALNIIGLHPHLVIGIPSGVTEVEKRAAREAGLQAGASEVYLLEEPMAAAIGAGLPVNEPVGSMIVDIGGGTTEVAVISLGGIVVNHSIRVGGNALDEAIIRFARQEHNLLIGERVAESAKVAAGSASPQAEETSVTLRGRSLITGMAKELVVSGVELREALSGPVSQIIEVVRQVLEETSPELVADIMDRGVFLSGGSALLPGLDERLSRETRMPIVIADDPLTCVARGTGIIVENLKDERYRQIIRESQAERQVFSPRVK
jgi:rod shape-determining protein MreB and related proteins